VNEKLGIRKATTEAMVSGEIRAHLRDVVGATPEDVVDGFRGSLAAALASISELTQPLGYSVLQVLWAIALAYNYISLI